MSDYLIDRQIGEYSPLVEVAARVKREKKNRNLYNRWLLLIAPLGQYLQTIGEPGSTAFTITSNPDLADCYPDYASGENAVKIWRERQGFSDRMLITVHDPQLDQPKKEL